MLLQHAQLTDICFPLLFMLIISFFDQCYYYLHDYLIQYWWSRLLVMPFFGNIFYIICCKYIGIEYKLINYRFYCYYYINFYPVMILLIDEFIKNNESFVPRVIYFSLAILMVITNIMIKPDRFIYKYFISSWENLKYNNYFLNKLPPKFVYSSNFRYNNIYKCSICLESFNGPLYEIEVILKCGHRFHSQCIRNWELIQFSTNPYRDYYHCALCKKNYDWKTKYHYIYTITY